jgi:hypothetical protein
MPPKPKPRRKPPVKPELGRQGRNLEVERQWEAHRRASRINLTLHPSPVQMSWLVQQAEEDETPGKTAARILFSKIDR